MSTRNHNNQSIIGSFTIRISKYKEQYKIQAIGPNDVVEAESSPFIWLPELEQNNTLRLFQHPIRVQSISLAQLTSLGQAMYRSVFNPNIAMAFGRVQAKLKESNGIRIRLLVEPPELAHLPWELMHDGHDFIALRSNYPLVRGTKDTLTTPEISIRGKLKILYAWASPEAEAELNLEESAERIQSLLAANNKIHFEVLEKATLTKLRSKLDQGYHVFCFAGHGTSESIYLEKDDDKYADKVSGLTLARALEGTQTRLVFLAACETGTLVPSTQKTFGESLIHEANRVKAKVPSVVAMQYAVRDDQTNPLTARFFETLASFKPVDAALSEARKSILDEERQSMDVTRDVFAPVMYLQSESSNLFRKAHNWPAIGFAIAFVIAVLLGFIALSNAINSSMRETEARATAVAEATQRAYAEAQQKSIALADTSLQIQNDDPALALLLAIEAGHLADTPSVYSSLRGQLSSFPPQPLYVLQHNDDISGVRWNQDETVILTNSEDGTTKLWDAESGQLLHTLSHTRAVVDAQWNQAQSLILTRSDDYTAKLWDAESGQLIYTLSHQWMVEAFWNLSESKILTRSNDRTAYVWDAESGDQLYTLSHEGRILEAKWNADNTLILTRGGMLSEGGTTEGGTAKIWDSENGQLLYTLSHGRVVWGAAWNQDETLILTRGDDGTAKIWDAEDGSLLHTLSHTQPDGHMIQSTPGAMWNKNESLLLTSGNDGTAKIWDAENGRLLYTLPHENELYSARWNQDETLIFTQSDNGLLRAWNAKDGQLLYTLSGVVNINWNEDDSLILTINTDQTASVWEAANGLLLHTLLFEGDVNTVKWWNTNGRLIFASSDDLYHSNGTILVWDGESGEFLYSLPYTGRISHSKLVDDGSKILTLSSDNAKIWDTNDGRLLFVLPQATNIMWNKDNSLFLTIDADYSVRAWNIQSNHQQIIIQAHQGSVLGAQWSQDESNILTFSEDGTAKVWNAQDGQLLYTLSHQGSVLGAQWSQDESKILTFSEDDTAKVWNAQNGQIFYTLSHQGNVLGAQWGQDESKILTFSEDGTAKIWNAQNGQLLYTFTHQEGVLGAQWSQDESNILTFSKDGTAKVWNAESGQILFELASPLGIFNAIQWSKNGNYILSNDSRTIRIWSVTDGSLLLSLPRSDFINFAQFNEDETLVLGGGQDGTTKVWEVESGQLLFILPHRGFILGAQWNQDESQIITQSSDGTAKVWDAGNGQLLHTLSHERSIVGSQWNQYESLILTHSNDGTAKVWDAVTGELLRIFTGNGTPITAANWSNDENTILLTTESGSVNIYNYVHMNTLIAAACQAAIRNLTWDEWQRYLPWRQYQPTCSNLACPPSVIECQER